MSYIFWKLRISSFTWLFPGKVTPGVNLVNPPTSRYHQWGIVWTMIALLCHTSYKSLHFYLFLLWEMKPNKSIRTSAVTAFWQIFSALISKPLSNGVGKAALQPRKADLGRAQIKLNPSLVFMMFLWPLVLPILMDRTVRCAKPHPTRRSNSVHPTYSTTVLHPSIGKPLNKKNGKKRGHCPLWATPPPLNGSKGDICCLITDKSA